VTQIVANPDAGNLFAGSRFRRRLLRRFPFGLVYQLDAGNISVIAVSICDAPGIGKNASPEPFLDNSRHRTAVQSRTSLELDLFEQQPETVCAAGRLNKLRGSRSAPAAYQFVCAWFQYQAYLRVFGGSWRSRAIDAADFGLFGLLSMTIHPDFCDVKVHGGCHADDDRRLLCLAGASRLFRFTVNYETLCNRYAISRQQAPPSVAF
jgi:hypothetical protein